MWTYNGKAMRAGRTWKDSSGRMYPPQWFGRTTDAEKIAIGWVWTDDPAPYDNRFYWSAELPKEIDDINVTNDDGTPMLDENGNQVVQIGLKSNAIAQTKTVAASFLAPTDWYVVRKSETDEAIPEAVLTYRQAVRTASNAIEAAISACTTHDAFMALYDVPVDADGKPTGNAPINDWPENTL